MGADKAEVDVPFQIQSAVLETIAACLASAGHDILASKIVSHATPHTSVPNMQHYREILPKLSTLPRDVAVIKSFDDARALWDVLLLASKSPVTFCRCFDLVVSLLATVIGRWSSFDNARNRVSAFNTTA